MQGKAHGRKDTCVEACLSRCDDRGTQLGQSGLEVLGVCIEAELLVGVLLLVFFVALLGLGSLTRGGIRGALLSSFLGRVELNRLDALGVLHALL